jgi:hypothetical protein
MQQENDKTKTKTDFIVRIDIRREQKVTFDRHRRLAYDKTHDSVQIRSKLHCARITLKILSFDDAQR